MEKFLVMISGIGPTEFEHYHEALACQKDYRAAGHTADIFIHNGIVPAVATRDLHVEETFGPEFTGTISASPSYYVDRIPSQEFTAPVQQPKPEESDPHGTSPHAPGAKLDAGKNRLGLVLGGFASALWEVGRVGSYGANKYTEDGWKSVPNAKARYMDAMMRHMLLAQCGEIHDADTQLLHLAHAAWNALAVLHFEIEDQGIPF